LPVAGPPHTTNASGSSARQAKRSASVMKLGSLPRLRRGLAALLHLAALGHLCDGRANHGGVRCALGGGRAHLVADPRTIDVHPGQ
jgi:hypothetical protein